MEDLTQQKHERLKQLRDLRQDPRDGVSEHTALLAQVESLRQERKRQEAWRHRGIDDVLRSTYEVVLSV